MYRPVGWENPYKDIMNPHTNRQGVILKLGDERQERAYEAGADAMLEALRKQPISIMIGGKKLNLEEGMARKGILVFIPDDKE